MISVDAYPKRPDKLLVALQDSPPETTAALDSLLTAARSNGGGAFVMAAWEFAAFQQALDELGANDPGEMTEAAAESLRTFSDFAERAEAIKSSPPDWALLDQISGWKTKPYADQLQCVRFHTTCGRSIEAGETGIGKSLSVLLTFLYWRTQQPGLRGLILCANAGKLDWEAQVAEHTEARVVVCGNGTQRVLADVERFKSGDADLLAVHYDALLQKPVLDALLALEFGYIAMDEAHLLKNPTTRRHKNVFTILGRNRRAKMTCATGTAIDGSPKSAWALLRVVLPGYLPRYHVFYDYYTIRKEKLIHGRKFKVDVGVRNLRHLKDVLAPVAIRFLKADVTGRPSKIFQTRLAELTGQQKLFYERIRNAVRGEMDRAGAAPLSLAEVANRMLRLRQMLNHPAIAGEAEFRGESCKYEELDGLLEEVLSNPDAQVLVWTQWRDAVDRLVRRYREFGAIALYGGSKDAAVRDQVQSKKARVVVAIPEKAATSIDWLKCVRTAVYLEKPWSLTLYRQSLDRIDRRANTDPALIVTIECPNTVDQLVNTLLQNRQNVFDALSLDDEKLVTLGQADLLKYLE